MKHQSGQENLNWGCLCHCHLQTKAIIGAEIWKMCFLVGLAFMYVRTNFIVSYFSLKLSANFVAEKAFVL